MKKIIAAILILCCFQHVCYSQIKNKQEAITYLKVSVQLTNKLTPMKWPLYRTFSGITYKNNIVTYNFTIDEDSVVNSKKMIKSHIGMLSEKDIDKSFSLFMKGCDMYWLNNACKKDPQLMDAIRLSGCKINYNIYSKVGHKLLFSNSTNYYDLKNTSRLVKKGASMKFCYEVFQLDYLIFRSDFANKYIKENFASREDNYVETKTMAHLFMWIYEYPDLHIQPFTNQELEEIKLGHIDNCINTIESVGNDINEVCTYFDVFGKQFKVILRDEQTKKTVQTITFTGSDIYKRYYEK